LFANMYDAYDALSEGMRRMLDPLNAMHSGKPYGVGGVAPDLKVSRSIGIERNRPEADREVAHPVVRVHPATGRKALFVNSIYTTRFEGMTEAESRRCSTSSTPTRSGRNSPAACAGGPTISPSGTTAAPCTTRSTITTAPADSCTAPHQGRAADRHLERVTREGRARSIVPCPWS
jgi:hypothetical protein